MLERVGGLLLLRNAFSFVKNQDLAASKFCSRCSRFVPEKMREGEGEENEAKLHFLFKRKQEKAEGARFRSPLSWNNKNLTLSGNGSASKRA